MRPNGRHSLGLLAVLAAVLLSPAHAGTASAELLEHVRRPVGMAFLPRCSDSEVLAAIARRFPAAQVYGQHPDSDVVARARDALDRDGLLNRRITVDPGDVSRLLPIGNSCDLVLMTDIAERDLTPAFAAEVRRVLHPWYGIAILGDQSGALPSTALQRWAERIHDSVSPVEGSGTYVRVEAPPLPGADDWPMWWHDPGNSAFSQDTAYALDESFQWAGKPYIAPREELPIVSDGRLFMLWNSAKMGKNFVNEMTLERLEGEGPFVTAHATGSGQILWARRLSPAAWGQASRSAMVADGDAVLVADGGILLELDAATGDELHRVESGTEEIRWLALAEEKVLLLGGPKSPVLGLNGLTRQVEPFRSGGLQLTALDRKSLKKKWEVVREPGADAFDPRSPAVADGRVFVTTENGTAEGFRLQDGLPLWQTPTHATRAEPVHLDWDFTAWNPVTGFAVEEVYIYSATEMRKAYAFKQEDGRLLWSTATRKQAPFIPLPIDGELHRVDRMSGNQAFDPLTGESSTSWLPMSHSGVWCARVTASPLGIFTAEGQRVDVSAGKPCDIRWRAKSSCTVGSFVADGLLWKVPLYCRGCTQWLGFLVRCQREETPPPPPRLAVSHRREPDRPPARGWNTYRGNQKRSASSPAEVGTPVSIRWQTSPLRDQGPFSADRNWSLDVEIVPTPPVTVGDTVLLGGGDGTVEAFDLSTGSRRWRAQTGGRIYSSPTVWRDRVFAGSADGHLYCFALSDGREMWRLRVAPDAGRMMLYGQNGSRWPVLCSPLVSHDRVIAAAGLVNAADGVWAVAADPVTGRLLWQRRDWSDADPHGELSGAGQLCRAEDGIVYHGGAAPLVHLSTGDGATCPAWKVPGEDRLDEINAPDESRVSGQYNMYIKGQEVGALSSDWLLCGGSVLFTDQAWSGNGRTALTFVSTRVPGGIPLVRARDSIIMPAWDDRDFLAVIDERGRSTGLVLIPQERLLARFQDALHGRTGQGGRLPRQLLAGVQFDDEELHTWKQDIQSRGKERQDVYGCALTANSALLLWHGSDSALTAYDRSTGGEMWTVKLPSIPLRKGLAVAADGSLIVTLRDGSLICVGEP